MPAPTVFSRRHFLKDVACFAGVAPLLNLTLPQPAPLSADLSGSVSRYPALLSVTGSSHGFLVLDTTASARAEAIAAQLAAIGTTHVAAGHSVESAHAEIDHVQASVGLSTSDLSVIGLGAAVPHLLMLANAGLITRLVIDLSETAALDLSAEFETLQSSLALVLIVPDLSLPASWPGVIRFVRRTR